MASKHRALMMTWWWCWSEEEEECNGNDDDDYIDYIISDSKNSDDTERLKNSFVSTHSAEKCLQHAR